MKAALNTMVGGEPVVVVNKELRALDRVLRGAWHYKTDVSGNLVARGKYPTPVKNELSRIGECFAYACNILRPSKGADLNHPAYRRQRERTMSRARNYAVGGF